MTRWLLLCAACVVVYTLPTVAGSPGGAWFFVANSSWSFALCACALFLVGSRTALAVAAIECAAIVLNLVCLWQYMTVTGWIYSIYEGVIDALVIAEAAVLIIGAPWNGIRRIVRERWGDHYSYGPAYMRSGMDRQEGKA